MDMLPKAEDTGLSEHYRIFEFRRNSYATIYRSIEWYSAYKNPLFIWKKKYSVLFNVDDVQMFTNRENIFGESGYTERNLLITEKTRRRLETYLKKFIRDHLALRVRGHAFEDFGTEDNYTGGPEDVINSPVPHVRV